MTVSQFIVYHIGLNCRIRRVQARTLQHVFSYGVISFFLTDCGNQHLKQSGRKKKKSYPEEGSFRDKQHCSPKAARREDCTLLWSHILLQLNLQVSY